MSWFISHIDWTAVVSITALAIYYEIALAIYYEIMPATSYGVCKLVQFLKRKVWR